MASFRIPLSDLDLGADEREAVLRVLDSQWLTIGTEVAAFEQEFAQLCRAPAALCVSSCTAALHLACLALGVGPGTEVIVPSLTFVASANSVALCGGRPVFADVIGEDDLTLDPADVERRITPATRGVMCVHYAGFPCRMAELSALCERHGLFLIEDVAHAPGVDWEGRALGTIGDVGCFSFFGNKNLTTGEGGMVLARDDEVRERIRLLRSHGMTSMSWDRFSGHAWDYDVVRLGLNYRPTEFTGALGRVQLTKLRDRNVQRNRLLDRYRERLDAVPGVTVPFAGRHGSAHIAVALVDRAATRDPLREMLGQAGIQTSMHYPPAHLFRHYRETLGTGTGDLPVTEDVASRLVTLPLYPTMALEQVDEVCAQVADFVSDDASAST